MEDVRVKECRIQGVALCGFRDRGRVEEPGREMGAGEGQYDRTAAEIIAGLRRHPEDIQCQAAETKGTAWRLETSLREFPNIVSMEFWFGYPLHRVDKWEELKKLPAQGTFEAGKVKNKYHKITEEANEEFREAFALQCIERKEEPVSEMAELLGIRDRTVRNRVANLKEEFHLENGIIKRGKTLENKASKAKKKRE